MDLEVETLPSDLSTDANLLDGIHLDLELECEEDGVAYIPDDKCSKAFTYENIFANDKQDQDFQTDASTYTNTEIFPCSSTSTFLHPNQSISETEFLNNSHIYKNVPSKTILPVGIIMCHFCRILFTNLQTLQLHLAEQHFKIKEEIEDFNTFICSICQKPFGSKKTLTKHRKRHFHSIKSRKRLNQGPFPCPKCSYVGKSKVLLKLHTKNLHNPERKHFQCDQCPFSCVQERYFKLHKRTHEDSEGKFACDQCGKLFFTMSILKRHARTHNTHKPYVCTVNECKKAFNIKSRLTDHIRNVHKKPHLFNSDKAKLRQNKNESIVDINKLDDNIVHKENSQNLLVSGDENRSKNFESSMTLAKETDCCAIESSSIINGSNSKESDANNANIIIVYDIILPEQIHASQYDGGKIKLCKTHTYNTSSNNNDYDDELTILRNGNRAPASNTLILTGSQNLSQPTVPECFTTSNNSKLKPSQSNKKFTCTWMGCDKSFRDNYNLRKHVFTHTGEMERSCPFCRYRCIQKSALDKHLKIHKKKFINNNKC